MFRCQLCLRLSALKKMSRVCLRLKISDLQEASQLHSWNQMILNLDSELCQPAVTLQKVFVPDRDVNCEILTGNDDSQIANSLTDKLLELKVL